MTTTVECHEIVDAKMERKSSNGTNWIVLIATNKGGERSEFTMFHDGELRVDANVNALLPTQYIPPQIPSGSALPRPGSDPDSSAGDPRAGQTRTISGSGTFMLGGSESAS